MMYKTLSLTYLALAASLLCSPVLAEQSAEQSAEQNTNNSTENKAEVLLSQIPAATVLKQKLSMLSTFQADFEQRVADGQGELVQESRGELILKQPNLMVWQVNEPDENKLVADGETLWYLDPFVEQVSAMVQAESVASNPVVLLTDPDNQSWQDFNVGQQQDKFIVTASKPESQIVELQLTFDAENRLVGLTFVDRQQQVSSLTFSEIKQNHPISNALFSFSVPEGFELDDQR